MQKANMEKKKINKKKEREKERPRTVYKNNSFEFSGHSET